MQKLIKGITIGTFLATILFAVLFRVYPAGVILSLAITAGIDLIFVIVQRYNRPRIMQMISSLQA